MEFLFSVFTPTYNRAGTIARAYNHLCKQTLRNFEWIVIDDGSTDNTEETIREWIKEGRIHIVYIKQANGGKHRAFNRAVQIAKGEIFICLDSDDYYIETSLRTIAWYYEQVRKKEEVVGFSCLVSDFRGNLIGTELPSDQFICSHYDLYHNYNVKGDKGLIYYTHILRKFPFPEFEYELFVPEALILNRISRYYKICCINKVLCRVEYRDDGLSNQYRQLCLRNPKGYSLYINELNYFKLSFVKYILNNASYVKYSLKGNKKNLDIYYEAINKRWTFIIAHLLGILLYIKDRKK
ncbi:glycosyltransferase family 2 protein [Bacteroides clarus]|jgi:glycosyltransferase involved in cell wall biosynthesis|uniref:Glycosyltransferase 2-like domain-containing protein n=2 Tax=Bacteroides clarus TaxID=626929 RepID=A0A1Y4JU49_9BACE|nr:glycosyltransferase family 2 protein [Bacteroides clarus]OUP34790.1 hypothetical protein B5F24_06315 [Bacteroides clarus]